MTRLSTVNQTDNLKDRLPKKQTVKKTDRFKKDRHTDKKADRMTKRKTEWKKERQNDKKKDRLTKKHRLAKRKTDWQKERQTNRYINKNTAWKKTGREAKRQTDSWERS